MSNSTTLQDHESPLIPSASDLLAESLEVVHDSALAEMPEAHVDFLIRRLNSAHSQSDVAAFSSRI